MVGHLKDDCGLRRNWLKGSEGDVLHPVLCAAGYNLRWLMRAIARLGLKALFALWRCVGGWSATRGMAAGQAAEGGELNISGPTIYDVIGDITIPSGIVRSNPTLGQGGAMQYFIRDYSKRLRLVDPIKFEN